MSPRILIAGIGNIFLGDDAFGTEVARRLLARSWPCNVRVGDFGIRGFDLSFALLDGYDVVILIDAVARGGRPGTLYKIELDPGEFEQIDPNAAGIETHGMNPMRVLAFAKSSGAQFERMFLIGCEPSPESVDPEGPGAMGLSDPVRCALDEAVRLVEKTIEEVGTRSFSTITQATGGS